jgi:gamma-glutamyltranspeptidase/glutathione hydrolase/leukotriene-C4 hydrolase
MLLTIFSLTPSLNKFKIYIFSILSYLPGYNFTPKDLTTDDATAKAYHKIIETFRYAYARRALLGDKEYANVTQVSLG